MKAPAVVSEIYGDYEKLVYHTVHGFVRKYGGDTEEMISEANLIFLNAVDKFDHERGTKFSTYLVRSIHNRLYNVRKAELAHARRYNSENGDLPMAATIPARPDSGFYGLHDLTEDAKTVLGLIIDTPAEILAAVSPLPELSGGRLPYKAKINRWRTALRGYLLWRDWAAERIDESFGEIEGALAA